jgi:hypothetical protein
MTLSFILRLATCLLTILLVPVSCKKNEEKKRLAAESQIKPSDFLSAEKYQTLMVDFVYDAGHPPSADAVANLKKFLNARLNKPGGVQMIVKEITASGKDRLSITEVQHIESKTRSYFSQGSILGVFIYYANSEFAGNSGGNNVPALKYGNTSLVLFGKTISTYPIALGKPTFAIIETAIVEHEFCHLLGLVDGGTPMLVAHKDAGNKEHCSNVNCLMHHMIETTEFIANLVGSNVPELDSNCLADLKNNGGK